MSQLEPEQIELHKKEYYEALAENPELSNILNKHGGLLMARSRNYPPWPARFSEPGEFAKMCRHRKKKGNICVYFFGTRNYGWVSVNAVSEYSEDPPNPKLPKKYSVRQMEDAKEEAKALAESLDELSSRFYDRIMERKDGDIDMPCESCNRVDDHYSLLILCDGEDCNREYHMNCLIPPLEAVPPGQWFCPSCVTKQHKQYSKPLPTSKGANSQTKRSIENTKDVPSTSSDDIKHEHSRKRKLPKTPSNEQHYTESGPNRVKALRQNFTPPTVNTNNAQSNMSGNINPNVYAHNSYPMAEDRCLICGYGGEVVECDFIGCTKVYHELCLGAYPFPKLKDTPWLCPRHTCVLSGQQETPIEDTYQSKHKPSPRKVAINNMLWKCNLCPVSIAEDVLPPLTAGLITSKKTKAFICPYCNGHAPSLVELGKMLEKVWSTMATNRQGLPFYGPLLSGIEQSTLDHAEDPHDLVSILGKIRRLQYTQTSSFFNDIENVINAAMTTISGKSIPLMQAAKTITSICHEQLQKFDSVRIVMDEKVDQDMKLLKDSSYLLYMPKNWPIRWRQECGSFDQTAYRQIEARTLDEWTAHVISAPLFVGKSRATLDDHKQTLQRNQNQNQNVHIYTGTSQQQTAGYTPQNGSSKVPTGLSSEINQQFHLKKFTYPDYPHEGGSSDSQSSSQDEQDTFSVNAPRLGLSLSEGTDVMIALQELSQPRPNHKLQIGQELKDDDMSQNDFFLSPSLSEMQQMFDHQSRVLRRALERHAALQNSWSLAQQNYLFGGTTSNSLTIGESRLAAELRASNKNLKVRLERKDQEIDQLMTENSRLQAQLKVALKQVREKQLKLKQLDEDGPHKDGLEKSIDSSEELLNITNDAEVLIKSSYRGDISDMNMENNENSPNYFSQKKNE